MKWREVFAQEQRKLPKHATPKQRGEAARRASAIYRGGRAERSNPAGSGNALQRALLIGLGYVAIQMLARKAAMGQPVAPTVAGAGTAAVAPANGTYMMTPQSWSCWGYPGGNP